MDVWGIPLVLVTLPNIFLGGVSHARPPVSLGESFV